MDCKNALVQASGDEEEAIKILRTKGIAKAAKKATRAVGEGLVQSYIHPGGGIGVLLELSCESDFVAKNEIFIALAKDICLHIAASAPLVLSKEELSEQVVDRELEIARKQAEGKPPAAVEKIVEGKLNKFFSEVILLKQAFVKDSTKTIEDLIVEAVQKLGENIKVRRFTRYNVKD